ncbi:MAG: serine/threonine-protein kinase [Flavobacteriia bacterium]|nr:serine/threonine-protein kinase [Flavobacteriia bacterium]
MKIEFSKNITSFKYAGNLTEFPRELFELEETLELLDLSNNQLSELPSDFDRFKKLKIAFFSDNLFTELPDVLGKCRNLTMIGFKSNLIQNVSEQSLPKQLQWLILTNNKIELLPNSIGNCEKLRKVALAGNKIKELPNSMANCKNLELLRISANELKELPLWLIELPNLTWLAFSGNPCTFKPDLTIEIDTIDWTKIEQKEILGQGASGIISKAILRDEIEEEVAIKIFKGEVTSDGYPEDELATSLAVGRHSNLVPLIGKIVNHSEGKEGIVLELIPSTYKVLGNPPSFESCTRDVFPEGITLTQLQKERILSGVKSAMEHLHSKGILHGDLYAHNTLYNEEGHTFFGDFGAATFFDIHHPTAELLKTLDYRAFQCLVEDIGVETSK